MPLSKGHWTLKHLNYNLTFLPSYCLFIVLPVYNMKTMTWCQKTNIVEGAFKSFRNLYIHI